MNLETLCAHLIEAVARVSAEDRLQPVTELRPVVGGKDGAAPELVALCICYGAHSVTIMDASVPAEARAHIIQALGIIPEREEYIPPGRGVPRH